MSDIKRNLILNTDSFGANENGAVDLVILHGLFGSGDNWRANARQLSGDRRIHLMDLRNHGDSPHDDSMTYPQMADDVIATCDQLQLERVNLLGHSMGGKVAMQIAQQYPDRLKKLVIVDISPRAYEAHHTSVFTAMHDLQSALSSAAPLSRKQADSVLARHIDDAGLRAFLLKSLRRNQHGGHELKINLAAIAAGYDNIRAAVQCQQPFHNPVLFIKGELSDYLTEADRKPIAAMFPNAQMKVIGGAGHWPHAEKASAVNGVLSRFLGQP